MGGGCSCRVAYNGRPTILSSRRRVLLSIYGKISQPVPVSSISPLVPRREDVGAGAGAGRTNSVVKFMVNVRLVLNNVNNHVGSVYVEKLIAQNDILCRRYAELYTSDTDSQNMLCCVESGEDSDVARSGGAAAMVSRREDVRDEEAMSAMLSGFQNFVEGLVMEI